jgi:hypothetical protein
MLTNSAIRIIIRHTYQYRAKERVFHFFFSHVLSYNRHDHTINVVYKEIDADPAIEYYSTFV